MTELNWIMSDYYGSLCLHYENGIKELMRIKFSDIYEQYIAGV